jgi:hypothetical protein
LRQDSDGRAGRAAEEHSEPLLYIMYIIGI